jgi:hypothetical protein
VVNNYYLVVTRNPAQKGRKLKETGREGGTTLSLGVFYPVTVARKKRRLSKRWGDSRNL